MSAHTPRVVAWGFALPTAFFLLLSGSLPAQSWELAASLTRPGQPADDSFGRAVSVSGQSILVGAPSEGAAYLLSGADWADVTRLVPTDPTQHTNFGGTVAVDGEIAFVGTTDINPAAVHPFRLSVGTWTETQELREANSETFGYRIALRSNLVAIGAPKDAEDTGKVHVYAASGESWSETQELVASDAQPGDFYSLGLDFDGELLVVGAPGNLLFPTERAGVYVYSLSGSDFSEQTRLTVQGPPDIAFGSSVAVSGTSIAVAAPPGPGQSHNGQVIIFVRGAGSWEVEQILTVPEEEIFGSACRIQGDTAWLGARTGDKQSVYVFRRSAGVWTQTQKLDLPETGTNTIAFAVGDATLAVGLAGDAATGSVRAFQTPDAVPPLSNAGGAGNSVSANDAGMGNSTIGVDAGAASDAGTATGPWPPNEAGAAGKATDERGASARQHAHSGCSCLLAGRAHGGRTGIELLLGWLLVAGACGLHPRRRRSHRSQRCKRASQLSWPRLVP
jgi:hypothetical protein